jgi:hypothetical protein
MLRSIGDALKTVKMPCIPLRGALDYAWLMLGFRLMNLE